MQALRRLVCVCGDCHLATHMGFAEASGRGGEAFAHLCEVTGLSEADARLRSPPGAGERGREARRRPG
ncbi:hypothetical protein ACSNOI_16975 [Actinomadura kijaniata]|uniref:hypothetical protein n=1 Tax=Actinomadura kijaniata TaxID=46161 RepID=UPI003F1D2FE8